MGKKKELYVGIEAFDRFVSLAYYREGMKDVDIISVEERGLSVALIEQLIQKIPDFTDIGEIQRMMFHLEKMDFQEIEEIYGMMEKIKMDKKKIGFMGSKECLFEFVLHQPASLMMRDVLLLQCREDDVEAFWVWKEKKEVFIEKEFWTKLPKEKEERDDLFAKVIEERLRGKVVSCIYITGEGFLGNWGKTSFPLLSKGRKAFQGSYLFCTGACYGAENKYRGRQAGYTYQREFVWKEDIFLKVQSGNRTLKKVLAKEGTNYYEVQESCDVLLGNTKEVQVFLQSSIEKEARVRKLELTGLQERHPKACRLRIELLPKEQKKINIRITDLGLGALVTSSGKIWEYCVNE